MLILRDLSLLSLISIFRKSCCANAINRVNGYCNCATAQIAQKVPNLFLAFKLTACESTRLKIKQVHMTAMQDLDLTLL